MSYAAQGQYVGVSSNAKTRARFIMRTYAHLFGALMAFTGLEVLLFQSGAGEGLAIAVANSPWIALGGFIAAGWIGSHLAHSIKSQAMQYVGLSVIVVAYAIFFLPILYIAQATAPGAIQSAATVSLLGFSALTAAVYSTRKDFSFMGTFLRYGFLMALVLIVASAIFGFTLGSLFSVAMVLLAGGAILYDTSNVLHHFPEDRYVGAATELFSSVAMFFFYILRLFISSRD